MTMPDYKVMYEAERVKFQGETRISSFLAERLRAARGSANRCDQCRQARGEWVVRRGDDVLWLCRPCTAGTRADVPPFIGAARIAEPAPEPCLCAGHYMACDEPCPDFWLPDVPMSPDKGHAETAPEEGP